LPFKDAKLGKYVIYCTFWAIPPAQALMGTAKTQKEQSSLTQKENYNIRLRFSA
jgi:hypothetical protein